jgi:hypothetical protein
VGIVAPERSSLLGLVSRLAPVLVSGNVAVVIASETRPLAAVTLTEVLATSDVPGGVVNLLTGLRSELVPVLAAHVDVDAIDTWGVAPEAQADVESAACRGPARRPRGVVDERLIDRRSRRRAPGGSPPPRDEDVGTHGGDGSPSAVTLPTVTERRTYPGRTPRRLGELHDCAQDVLA